MPSFGPSADVARGRGEVLTPPQDAEQLVETKFPGGKNVLSRLATYARLITTTLQADAKTLWINRPTKGLPLAEVTTGNEKVTRSA